MDPATGGIALLQFGLQLVETTYKAVKLWRDIHKYPEKLEEALSDLKFTETAFKQLASECDDKRLPPGMWKQSPAKEAIDMFLDLVIKMQAQGEEMRAVVATSKRIKREVKLLKEYLRKDKIQALQEQCQRAEKRLTIGLMTWNAAKSKFEQEYLIRRVTQEVVSVTKTSGQEVRSLVKTTTTSSMIPRNRAFFSNMTREIAWYGKAGYQAADDGWSAFWKGPAWLTTKALEFHYSNAYSISSYHLRSYNVVSKSALVFTTIKSGDVTGLMNLLKSGQASPLDRDEEGSSLLYHAAEARDVGVCKALLSIGCHDMIDDKSNASRRSPLDVVANGSMRWNKGRFVSHDGKTEELQALFKPKLIGDNEVPAMRLLDFIREPDMADEKVFHVLQNFTVEYFDRPLCERLEAVRYGSFNLRTTHSLKRLLNKTAEITSVDVSASVKENISLLHSAAIGLGRRFADHVFSYHPLVINPNRLFSEWWPDLVTEIAQLAQTDELHSMETVRPWQDYLVPQWKGTPLISLLGGALTYLTAYRPQRDWDRALQAVLKRWLDSLLVGGVDLLQYGWHERLIMNDVTLDYGGALGIDATEASRKLPTFRMDELPMNSVISRVKHDERLQIRHTIPIRVVSLAYGPYAEQWKIWWAPEFEAWGGRFIDMCERTCQPPCRMPGGWYE